jgi:CRISPR type III-B/RAMP module-associated protein Cmr5
MASRQQTWAIKAHGEVQNWTKSEKRAKYKTWCRRSASLLQQSGLVQTVVFMQAKGDDGATVVGNAMARVLHLDDNATLATLVEAAKRADTPTYMALTRNLTSVCVWFRRFAEIEIADEEEN